MVSIHKIDGKERDLRYLEYIKTGIVQIPVANYIDEAFESDNLTDSVETYYTDLDDLIEVLDVSHLPSTCLESLREFLKENFEVIN